MVFETTFRPCKEPGCERTHAAKGYCSTHYTRYWKREQRAGMPDRRRKESKRPPDGTKICGVDGCGRKHAAKGLCSSHYSRFRRQGDPQYANHQARLIKGPLPALVRICAQCNVRPADKNSSRYSKYCPECRRDRNHDKARAHSIKSRYGVDAALYDQKLAEQSGVCALCLTASTGAITKQGRIRRLAFDHNHITGQVRGLLCPRCNPALERIENDREWARRALEYLATWDAKAAEEGKPPAAPPVAA